MKKLALLLAAVGMVSAVAYAAPELTVTSVGQEIEIENSNHNGTDLDEVNLYNNVGLAYGDWSIGLQAGKQWAINWDDSKDVHSKSHRLQIDVWNKVTDDLKLGFRYRGTSSYDRFYGRWDWNNGLLWSAGDVWYQAESEVNDTNDSLQFEVFPIGVQYGPFKVGYFINYVKTLGDTSVIQKNGKLVKEDYIEHQIRAYWTFFKGEQLTLSTEGRFTLTADENYEKTTPYRTYDDFGRNRIYLKANYAMTENLTVYGSYAWEFRDFKFEDYKPGAPKDDNTENAYQNFIVGWSYKF
ncbi:MAG: hypothetical protein MR673_09605 [Fusobacterium perfoetens]|uniref:hypothetical protein n=1 Tax=Fusobacterium perfoetens TaxID=852 RepID=UPI0023F000B5|nr:hypothetical protein [Fusobacterium perfoetens]MCI6153357.1 hypothetical protein [Fusobacterium perfoetens]